MKIKIHKEGKILLLSTMFTLFAINLFFYFRFPHFPFMVTTILSALVLLFFVYFFRNPSRVAEIDDPSMVIAPSDGEIVVVEITDENEFFGDKRIQVSIFMSVFNVHAQWYPIAGKIIKTWRNSGRHMMAFLPKSSHENERAATVIETPAKSQVFVRQVAGALARRIVTYAHVGKICTVNEQLGFIKFGSRVDLYLPLDAEVYVTVGEKTVGNETIIARLNE
ncbi:MAG: phosphatidylserine decarboxylase family protein [Paludibacter sp.]|jgi:phosphatidylserine decarboxylase|nr:phosphatidylserine decarboxylase family protein [Paludibacter sp.]